MKKDDVFELVKALTPNEKRYFKIFAKQHGEESTPKYVDLFEAMEKLHEFDLDKLGELIVDKRILKFLNQEKKYLKEKLLDALRIFRGAKSVDSLLHRLLEDQAILYEKGLFSQSQRQLSKGKKLAQTFDRFAILVDILTTERKLAMEVTTQDLERQVRLISEQQQVALEELRNLTKFQSLWHTLLAQFRKEGQGEKRGIPAILFEPSTVDLLGDSENARSFSAKHLFYSCNSMAALITSEHKKASEFYKALILLWKARPDWIEEEPQQYMLVLSNFLNTQHKIGSYSKFPGVLTEVREIKIENFAGEAEAFQNIMQLELLHFLNEGICVDSRRSLFQMEADLERGLVKYSKKINASRRLSIYHNMMLAKFFLEDWKGANHWRTKIENDEDAKKVRREIFGFAKIMQLMIQYEFGDYDWIQNLYRNHSRSLEREDRLSDFYEVLLNGIHRLAISQQSPMKRSILVQMQHDISAIFEIQGESNIFGAEEAQKWVCFKLDPQRRLKDFINLEL
jgi:hypothetical protein